MRNQRGDTDFGLVHEETSATRQSLEGEPLNRREPPKPGSPDPGGGGSSGGPSGGAVGTD